MSVSIVTLFGLQLFFKTNMDWFFDQLWHSFEVTFTVASKHSFTVSKYIFVLQLSSVASNLPTLSECKISKLTAKVNQRSHSATSITSNKSVYIHVQTLREGDVFVSMETLRSWTFIKNKKKTMLVELFCTVYESRSHDLSVDDTQNITVWKNEALGKHRTCSFRVMDPTCTFHGHFDRIVLPL